MNSAKLPGGRFAGYFPEYYSTDVERDFIFSKPVGSGPLGLAERKADPVKWETLWDIKPYRLGVVQDYVNTTDLDNMISRGDLTVETAVSDAINLRKLARNRLDLVVIDQHVFDHLMATEAGLAPYREMLQFNRKRLEDKALFVCFRRIDANAEMIKRFNAALAELQEAPSP